MLNSMLKQEHIFWILASQARRYKVTNYDVIASWLSYPLCSIIEALCLPSKEERGKNEDDFIRADSRMGPAELPDLPMLLM
jgi:hypothetical protein